MTDAPYNLDEPLRLLKEASLPTGFEERLRERLAAAAGEAKVTRLRPKKRRHGLLLLAAIALPVAALAAGEVYRSQRSIEPVKPAVSAIQVERSRQAAPKSTSLPKITPPPSAQKGENVLEDAPQPKASKLDLPKRNRPASRASVTPVTVAPTPAKTEPAAVKNAPAKIESLDLSMPRRSNSGSKDSSTSAGIKTTTLRTATEQGSANASSGAREDSSLKREQAAERRGSDAAQQAKERVQARERKGQ